MEGLEAMEGTEAQPVSHAIAPTVPSLQSMMECPICISLICEPITISCGHSFCRVCLKHSTLLGAKKCPICREITHLNVDEAQESQMLKSLALMTNPSLYAERLAEAVLERKASESLHPCFFYFEMLFPGATITLHLFEPRYRLMMQRVVNTTRSFAYCFTGCPAVKGDICLLAKVKECEFMPDGRCLIEAILSERRVVSECFVETGTQGLYQCKLEPMSDAELTGEALTTAAELARQLVDTVKNTINFCGSYITRQHGAMPTVIFTSPKSLEALSLWVCGFSPLPDTEKVKLLKSTDTTERFQRTLAAFEALRSPPSEPKSLSPNLEVADSSTEETVEGETLTGVMSRVVTQREDHVESGPLSSHSNSDGSDSGEPGSPGSGGTTRTTVHTTWLVR